MKQRRATKDIILTPLRLEPEENDEVIDLPTELESLILQYIKHNRRRLSKKMQKLLSTQVIANGETWFSPEAMWAHDNFKQWAEERLSWLSQQPDARVEQAVYLIRNYGAPKYGWIAYSITQDALRKKLYEVGARLNEIVEKALHDQVFIEDITYGD